MGGKKKGRGAKQKSDVKAGWKGKKALISSLNSHFYLFCKVLNKKIIVSSKGTSRPRTRY